MEQNQLQKNSENSCMEKIKFKLNLKKRIYFLHKNQV